MKSPWLEKHSTLSFKITEMYKNEKQKKKKTGSTKGIFFFLTLWMEFLYFIRDIDEKKWQLPFFVIIRISFLYDK